MPGFARLNAGVVRIGRQLAKRRNIMWRLEFDLSLEQNSPDQPDKRVQNGRSATPLIVISRFELPLLGSERSRRPRGRRRTAGVQPAVQGCPSWARTRTLLIQSQACCQLHQGAMNRYTSHVTRCTKTPPRALVRRGTCNVRRGNGAEGIRTPGLLGAIQALSQLSYSPDGRLNLETAAPRSNPWKLTMFPRPPRRQK